MKAQMSPLTMVLLGILVVIAVIAVSYIGIYNSLVSLDVKADTAWADVETQYQRRYDLIPNLVNTAQGYIEHERELLTEITKLRSQWGEAATQSEKIEASAALESAISRLLLVVENYPDLKAIEAFRVLMTQLEGTENRIAVARRDYNAAVLSFNTAIRVFPSNIIANMMGMQPKLFFESVEGAQDAPVVDFD